MVTESVSGIVCRYKPLFESHWQVMILSPDNGRFYALHRRQTSKKVASHGHLEPTNVITASLTHRRNMSYINHVTTTTIFPYIRHSYPRFELAMYCLSIAIKITVVNQPNQGLYDAIVATLTTLNDRPLTPPDLPEDIETLKQAFNYTVLKSEGLPLSPTDSYGDQLARYIK